MSLIVNIQDSAIPDENLFYVVSEDGKDQLLLAENESELTGFILVISLKEINTIQARLSQLKNVIENKI